METPKSNWKSDPSQATEKQSDFLSKVSTKLLVYDPRKLKIGRFPISLT